MRKFVYLIERPSKLNHSFSDLESENRRLKEQRTCKICMDKEIGVVSNICTSHFSEGL